jgi:hypothetical protein
MNGYGGGKTGSAANGVETGELRAALECQLWRHFGCRRRIIQFDRRVSDYSTSFEIEDLDLMFEDGERLAIVFKCLSRRSLFPAARDARPEFLYNPRREIEVYKSALASKDLGTAAWYGAVIKEDADQYWLFIERVSAATLCHVGEFSTWKNAAAWLGRMHATFDTDRAWNRIGCLLRYDQPLFAIWMERAKSFVAVNHAVRRIASEGGWLVGRYESAIARLMASSTTLIHGEFYPSNILVRAESATQSICPVDWELAAAGPGLIDLAALIAGQWPEARKGEMVSAYHQSLLEHGASPASWSELRSLLDCGCLHVAIQWLTWSDRWIAPADQSHDWMEEAFRIAKRMEH